MILPESVEKAIKAVADQRDGVATMAGELLKDTVYDAVEELPIDEQLDIVFKVYEPDRVYRRGLSWSLSGDVRRELCVVEVPFCCCGGDVSERAV